MVLLGMATRVIVEWQGLVPTRLESLADAKAVALRPPRFWPWCLLE